MASPSTSTPRTSTSSNRWPVGSRHQVVWGIGRRHNQYDIENTTTLFFEPASRKLEFTNLFVQDTIKLGDELKLTAGIKFERQLLFRLVDAAGSATVLGAR